MRIATTTGLVVLICLIGGLSAAGAVWHQYQVVAERQQAAAAAALVERDFRQLKTLTHHWFVALDLFFEDGQGYVANSIARQADELLQVVATVEILTEQSLAMDAAVTSIAAEVAELAISGPQHARWSTGLAQVDTLSISIVENLERAADVNAAALKSSKDALRLATDQLTLTAYAAALAYLVCVFVGWLWANRKVVQPLQDLQHATQDQSKLAALTLRWAPLEILSLADALRAYAARVFARQQTIEAQNQQLADQLQEIKRTRDQLIQAEKLASVGQLAAGVAHEINNPMSFVATNLDVLQTTCSDLTMCLTEQREQLRTVGLKDPVLQDKLAAIEALWETYDVEFAMADIGDIFADCQEGTDRITRIVSQLSAFTDVSNSVSECDLQSLLAAQIEKAGASHVHLRVAHPVIVSCPQVRLEMAVEILLANALEARSRAARPDSPIHISAGHDAATGWIEVRDQGCGISVDIRHRIFDPFFTTKPVGEGVGLGLHFALATAQQADGELTVQSEEGKGSTFVLKLPLAKPRGALIAA
ncbi:MAG: ATP-binding protein [Pseudomonadota bacterium]